MNLFKNTDHLEPNAQGYIECSDCGQPTALTNQASPLLRYCTLCTHCYLEQQQDAEEVAARQAVSLEDLPPTAGVKYDSGKRRYSLLPAGTVNQVVDVLEKGATKYAPDNWQKVDSPRLRYYDAALRHIDAWFRGERLDDETSLPHLAHAVCCLLFLMWHDDKGDN